MRTSRVYRKFVLAIVCLALNAAIAFAQTGTIRGRVKAAHSQSWLPGANVLVQGTTVGASSDLEGRFGILNAPAGPHRLIISYVGYRIDTVAVIVKSNSTTVVNVSMIPAPVMGKAVVVTAQLRGQAAAINQQLSANGIVNVVSAQRIRDLPDNDAAESVGRLPGIAILRSNGQAEKISIRGLAPQYTEVMINGQLVPPTSSDRSMDLSIIPSNELQGIEVFKSVTPAMPADAIAGVVNFTTRRAERGFHGGLNLRSGYEQLANRLGQYNISADVSDRFFDNKLGVIITGSNQNQPWPNNELGVAWGAAGVNPTTGLEQLQVNTLSLTDQIETRKLYGGSLAFDYEPSPNNAFQYYTMFSRKNSNGTSYEKEYDVSVNKISYVAGTNNNFESMWTNVLNGRDLLFNRLQTDWVLGGSRTISNEPNDFSLSFVEQAAMTGGIPTSAGIESVPVYAKNNLSQTGFDDATAQSSANRESDWHGQLDLTYPIAITNEVTGYLKGGGYFRGVQRTYNVVGFNSGTTNGTLGPALIAANPGYEVFDGYATITNFLNPNFSAGNFLDGQFQLPIGIYSQLPQEFWDRYSNLYIGNSTTQFGDYTAMERVSAGYLMTKLNLGTEFILIAGARYESTDNNYAGLYVDEVSQNAVGQYVNSSDTSATIKYDDWFPNVQLKYSISQHMSLRACFTKTLSRPEYNYLVPTTIISRDSRSMSQGNTLLREARSTNYDLVYTYYSGVVGLFSVDGFYKRIADIAYEQNSTVLDPNSEFYGYSLSMPVNAIHPTDVYGFEVDWETNFRYLPNPFNGILLTANLTRLYGSTYFPTVEQEIGPPPYYKTVLVPSERKGPIPGMSKYIANVTLGYAEGNFSGRVSAIVQSNILTSVGSISTYDRYQKGFVRLDAIATYRLLGGLSVYWDMNNLNSMVETQFEDNSGYVTSENMYKWTIDVGVKYDI